MWEQWVIGQMSSPDVQDYCHPKAPYADKSIQVVAEEKDMSEQWVIGLMSSPDFQGGRGN